MSSVEGKRLLDRGVRRVFDPEKGYEGGAEMAS
jgi:hypothetical protein